MLTIGARLQERVASIMVLIMFGSILNQGVSILVPWETDFAPCASSQGPLVDVCR